MTYARLRRPDGSEVDWTSRRHRKRLGLRMVSDRSRPLLRRGGGVRARRVGGWVGSSRVGSICFALGSIPLYFDHDPTGGRRRDVLRRVLVLHRRQRVAVPRNTKRTDRNRTRLGAGHADCGRCSARRLGRIAWWAATVQLVGTVFFNITTFAATRTDLTLDQERHLIWAPDFFGSICFLVASWLAYSEVNHAVRPHSDGSTGWWIAALNLAGSVGVRCRRDRLPLPAHDRRDREHRTRQRRHVRRRALLPRGCRAPTGGVRERHDDPAVVNVVARDPHHRGHDDRRDRGDALGTSKGARWQLLQRRRPGRRRVRRALDGFCRPARVRRVPRVHELRLGARRRRVRGAHRCATSRDGPTSPAGGIGRADFRVGLLCPFGRRGAMGSHGSRNAR